jgi:hypothetical protein
MAIEATLERVSAIRQALADPALLLAGGATSARTGGAQAPAEGAGAAEAPAAGAGSPGATAQATGEGSFASALAQASAADAGPAEASSPAAYGALPAIAGLGALGEGASTAAGTSAGARIVAAAESQIGQTEQPPGSNESPAIAIYRSSTSGAIPGAPWCAYFASWAARQAGEPLGANGEGLGSVGEIWSWAQSTHRAIANGPGVVPKPGDLIVFGDEHVGIVRSVLPDGQIATIEGNYENKVAANVRTPTEATGYVEMG